MDPGDRLGRHLGAAASTSTASTPAISSLIGVNGYVTFIGGIVLLVFAGSR